MLNRRGLSLVELLIGIVLMGIIGAALVRVFTVIMGASTAQVQVAATQGEARVGTLLLPQEFREIGYDTNSTSLTRTSDLIAIGDNSIRFWASRGLGITCGTPTLTEFRIRRGIIGQRVPVLTDRVLLFLEFDPNAGFDDYWVPMTVSAIDLNSTCDGTDPAIRFTLSATPEVASGTAMALTNHRVGGPIRWFEDVEYGVVTDASTGQFFLGRRSHSLSEAALTPVVGPLTDANAFSLRYFNAAGTQLTAASAPVINVRSMEIRLRTTSESRVSLAGSTSRNISNFPTVTRVALRNALRP